MYTNASKTLTKAQEFDCKMINLLVSQFSKASAKLCVAAPQPGLDFE